MYDVIVVGGGAVGLFLAKNLKEKGNKVLVLEKNKEIGKKVCSGLVSPNIFKLIDFFPSKNEGLYFLEKEFDKARIWIGKRYYDFEGKAFLLERSLLDRFLAFEAKNVGVEIKTGERVIDLKEKKDFVLVETRTIFSSKNQYKAKIVAGCDGALSTVAEKVGLLKKKKYLLGIIFYLKKDGKRENFPELFFSLKYFPGFFAWRIPRKEKIEWGCALLPKYHPKERLQAFLKEKFKISLFKEKYFSSPIPYFYLKKATKGRIFLCGDSAGQVKPFTGGGLVYGLICAKIASQTISLNPQSLKKYDKEWKKILLREIKTGKFIQKSYFLPDFIKKIGILYLKRERKKIKDHDFPFSFFFKRKKTCFEDFSFLK